MARESVPAPEPAEFPPIPDYTPIRRIGRGSYGDVWLVQGVTGAWRALKVIWRSRFPEAAPFDREFRGVSTLMGGPSGAGLLALLHAGRDPADRYFYYVMELADDERGGPCTDPATYQPLTFKALLARRCRLPAAEVVAHGRALARALAELHGRGWLHRDIKPANLIIVGGVAKLADLGLVTSVAEAGTLVGTAGYLPPEGPGSPAADVYALGKVLYELATGRDRTEFPQLPADLGPPAERAAFFALNAVLLRACAADPAERWRDGAALLAALTTDPSTAARRRLPWVLGGLAGLAALVAVGAFVARSAGPPPPPAPAPAPAPVSPPKAVVPAAAKSLVVLPLENLSENPANAYFTDGMHQEIIATLQRATDLRVVSRDSALLLRRGTAPLAELARQAGVAHVITGSVRRSGDRVRIHLELRRAADDELLWTLPAREHDVSDVFAVQSRIADEVARVLQARGDQTGDRGARFTKVPRAYDLYLQAGEAFHRRFGGNSGYLAAVNESIRLLEEALALDPDYYAAAETLGVTQIFGYRRESDPERRLRHAEQARRWLERAAALMPGGAVDSAWANYYTRVEIDCVRAEELARHAVRVWPEDAFAHNRLGLALQGQGRGVEAAACFRRAIEIDPLNTVFWQNILQTLSLLRRVDEFAAAEAHVRATFGSDLAQFALPFHRARVVVTPPDEEPAGMAALLRSRKFAEALALNRRVLDSGRLTDPNRLLALCTHSDLLRRLHRDEEALAAGREAVTIAERLVNAPTLDRSEKEGRLAAALVRAGRVDEGLAAGRRFVEAMRVPAQQEVRWRREIQQAELLLRAGRRAECLALLRKLLAAPSGLTVPLLKTTPTWDDLRDDPDFIALLADPRNHTPF